MLDLHRIYGILREYRELGRDTVGDEICKGLLDYYTEQRNTILNYKGKSAVDIQKYEYYEARLFTDSYDDWWHRETKASINRKLWLLRRLKVGITPQEEFNIFTRYFQNLPELEKRFAMYGQNALYSDVGLREYFSKHGVK